MLVVLDDKQTITGSFWGEPEAGIVRCNVYVRPGTPMHSLLHETCHVICMTRERRLQLNGDAGSDDLEEASVCYLQILLADQFNEVGRDKIMRDMDDWGYSFRVSNTASWFECDAEDARQWLVGHGLIKTDGKPTFELRA